MFISEVFEGAPADKRGELETAVYGKLKECKISFTRIDNDPADTMEECVALDERLGAEIRKTIVVCNRQKTKIYLVVLPADKPFDTKTFCAKMECPRVSFASADLMQEKLGVVPGCATIMGVLKDAECQVQVVIDREVAEAEWFACNPGVNTSHIKFRTADLLNTFLPQVSHEAVIAEL